MQFVEFVSVESVTGCGVWRPVQSERHRGDVLRSKKCDFMMDGDEMTWRVNGQDLTLTAFLSAWVTRILASRIGFDYAFGQGRSMRPLSAGVAEHWLGENI